MRRDATVKNLYFFGHGAIKFKLSVRETVDTAINRKL